MATKRPTPKKQPAARKKAIETAVKIALQPSQDAHVFYANFFEVAHGPHDLTMYGVRVPAKLNRDDIAAAKSIGELHLTPDFQVVVSPSLVPELIKALQTQYEKWQAKHGSAADSKPSAEK